MLYRIARGGYSGGDPDLAINRGQMRVDGAGTDDQALSHLLIGQSLCHDAPLDVLSGGRAWLGIGAGDYEEEAVGSGLPFPPTQRALRAAGGDAPDLPAARGRRKRTANFQTRDVNLRFR
jgi:hypothetical protein